MEIEVILGKESFFGLVASEKKKDADQGKMTAGKKMSSGVKLTKVRAVLCIAGFCHKFVLGFGETSDPLYNYSNQENEQSSLD